jgi:DNA-binding NarL/FixJ family response regulator
MTTMMMMMATGTTTTRVALVEDDPGVRRSLAKLVGATAGLECVVACGTGEDAVRDIPEARPDVVVMDIKLPGMSGIECTRRLKRLLPELPVLMLTVYNESDLIFEALRAGAGGFLLKRSAAVELAHAIDDVLDGGAPITAHVARRIVDLYRGLPPSPDPAIEGLTDREREILDHVARGGRNQEIADVMNIGISTVRTHLRNIFRKLHVRSRTEAIARYRGN